MTMMMNRRARNNVSSNLQPVTANVGPSSPIFVTLMMEALHSSETLVLTRATWHNIPEDILQNQDRFHHSDSAITSWSQFDFQKRYKNLSTPPQQPDSFYNSSGSLANGQEDALLKGRSL
jgi:hypothetical protein